MLGSGKGFSQMLISENVSLYNLFGGQFGKTYQSKGSLFSLTQKDGYCNV